MRLIYDNKFDFEELSSYHYVLIGVNYSILIKADHVRIVPTEYRHMNFDRTVLENNSGILGSFFVLIPLSGIILSRFKTYKHFVLQHNKNSLINELGFAIRESNEFAIKEKIQGGLKLSEIKEGLDEDIYLFIKRLH